MSTAFPKKVKVELRAITKSWLRREFIHPAITAHKGRIVKTTGDGIFPISRPSRC
jgi:hypothetical protein